MSERIQILLQSRAVEHVPAADPEVAGMWAKALRTLRSASTAGLDPDSALSITYQAALQGATAVIRCAGYRVRGDGHHQHTFGAPAAVGSVEVESATRTLNVIRRRRHRAVHEWEAMTTEGELEEIRTATARLLAAAHGWLATERPGLNLDPPPTRSSDA